MFGFPISVINNQLFTDEKSKLVKTEKETICDINMVIFFAIFWVKQTHFYMSSTTECNVGTIYSSNK